MSFHYRYRKQIVIGLLIVIIIGSIGGFVIYKYQTLPKEKTIDTVKVQKIKKEKKEETIEKVEEYMVDIKGEVNNPGIYKLKKGSRIIDVVGEAGGLTESADTSVINLSKKITDEMVIIIYSRQEVENWVATKQQEEYLQKKCLLEEEGQVENDACIEEKTDPEEKQPSAMVNINTATKEELMTLSGIGETKAEAIISYREKTPFQKIEDLKNVSGIGDSTFEEIKSNITIK